MPTDLTGTPTSLGIGTYNTSVDAPSGLGFNAAMAEIDALIAARVTNPAGKAAGDVPVWNGTTWVVPSGTRNGTKFLRDDGSWQSISAGPGAPVTTLPASPTDGQQAILTDSTTAPTYAWLMQYSSAATKWVFLGGSPLMWQVATLGSAGAFTTTSSAAVDVTGATVTVPHTGTYIVEAGGYTGKEFSTDAGGVGWIININGAQVGEKATVYTQATFTEVGGVNKTLKQTLTSGWIVKLQANSNGTGTFKMEDHFIKLTPVTF